MRGLRQKAAAVDCDAGYGRRQASRDQCGLKCVCLKAQLQLQRERASASRVLFCGLKRAASLVCSHQREQAYG
jgi:hypothetical protein